MLQIVHNWILTLNPFTSYITFAGVGLIPMIVAFSIGADKTAVFTPANHDAIVFRGYISWSNLNWMCYPLFLPIALYFVRHIACMLFGVGRQRPNAHIISSTYFRGRYRDIVFEDFREIALNPKITVAAILFAGMFELLDFHEQLAYYYFNASSATMTEIPREPSWGYFFAIKNQTGVSWTANLFLVLTAHFCQYCLMFLVFFGWLLAFLHNIHYVNIIYQRYRVTSEHDEQYKIKLDFDDGNKCFGLRPLNNIFNTQVRIVALVGAFLLFSRYANVEDDTSLWIYHELAQISVKSGMLELIQEILYKFLPLSNELFSDFGQFFIAIFWLLALFMVSLPAFAKFLPLFSRQVRSSGLDRRQFLLQFIPPSNSKYGTPDAEQVDNLASRFAASSFWPSGDQRARLYYTAAFIVFFIIVFPIRPILSDLLPLFVYAVIVTALSIGVTSLFFLILRNILRYVDESLVK